MCLRVRRAIREFGAIEFVKECRINIQPEHNLSDMLAAESRCPSKWIDEIRPVTSPKYIRRSGHATVKTEPLLPVEDLGKEM